MVYFWISNQHTHRSTETAVLNVLSDISMALDSGSLAVLMTLDLSAAFDSVEGFPHILMIAHNVSDVPSPAQPHPSCCMGFHRARFLDQSFSSYIRRTYYSLLNVISLSLMLMLTTLRSVDSVVLRILTHLRSEFSLFLQCF